MNQSTTSKKLPYDIQERKVIAETEDLRVTEMILAPGEFVPWHYHTQVTDTFFCLEGDLMIETPRAGQEVRVDPGNSFAVPTPQAHRVSNVGQGLCRFVLVQGVGPYDFILLPDPPA